MGISFIFGLSVFLGSFLLFLVQPVLGKYILPMFGGTSAVWTTALLFFQTMLLFGYSYVFFLSRLSLRLQILIHSLLTISILGVLCTVSSKWQAPILPDISWLLPDTYSPILQVLFILTVSIGLPYFLLSTNSVVLQKWFSQTRTKKSPYPLYALSNAASLIAVISYPLVLEPVFTVKTQGTIWTIGFTLFCLLLLLCCFILFIFRKKTVKPTVTQTKNPLFSGINKRSLLLWLLLPAISSMMLLSTTNLLTQSVAPVPFLWLLPLCIYLLSFILTFSRETWYKPNLYAYTFLLLLPLAFIFTITGLLVILAGILVFSLLLFSSSMLCHGEVYRRKPDPRQLDVFYLAITLGSALGAFLVSIVAPLIFKGLWEVYLGFYFSFLVAVLTLVIYKNSVFYRKMQLAFSSTREFFIFMVILFPVVLTGTFFIMTILGIYTPQNNTRNFYGMISVSEKDFLGQRVKCLISGTIIHGCQYVSNDYRKKPTIYYTPSSGVGLALQHYPRKEKKLTVGIIGLGIGTLAAYGKKDDTYTFYEINPQVVNTAQEQFTYLKDSQAHIEIVLGDGRLSLQRENAKRSYDLFIIDAFSDDAIPVHLLTKEAFLLYLKNMQQDGVIAVNIANKYLDLKPVLIQLAEYYHLQYVFVHEDIKQDNSVSDWALLTRNQDFVNTPAITKAVMPQKKYKKVALWTDDFSNLLQILIFF